MTPQQFNALSRTELEKLLSSLPQRRFLSLVGPRFYQAVLELRSRKFMANLDQMERCLEADYQSELLANNAITKASITAKHSLPPSSREVL